MCGIEYLNCPHCDRRFCSRVGFKLHLRTHEDDGTPEEEDLPRFGGNQDYGNAGTTQLNADVMQELDDCNGAFDDNDDQGEEQETEVAKPPASKAGSKMKNAEKESGTGQRASKLSRSSFNSKPDSDEEWQPPNDQPLNQVEGTNYDDVAETSAAVDEDSDEDSDEEWQPPNEVERWQPLNQVEGTNDDDVADDTEMRIRRTRSKLYKNINISVPVQTMTDDFVSVNSFQCKLCPKRYTRKAYLSEHTITVHDNAKPFQCDICLKTFSSSNGFSLHKRFVHGITKSRQCEICKKEFSSQNSLSRHIKNIHRKREQSLKCSICSQMFNNSDSITKHIKSVHKIVIPFQSPTTFSSTRLALFSNIKENHKLQCATCSKEFAQPNLLSRHITETHVKPYRCKFCFQEFGHPGSLSTHEKIHIKLK